MSRSLKTLLPLLALSVLAHAQAIAPDPDPHTIDKSCLGPARIMNEQTNDGGQIQFETFMTSAVSLSPAARRVTLPLFKGFDAGGGAVYYIVTESSDCRDASKRRVNYAPKLGFLIDGSGQPVNPSVQKVTIDAAGAIHFPGTVDFRPVRIFTPSTAATPDGPQGFPPDVSLPGSKGDANYSPLITFVNSEGKHVVLNATHVANSTGIKDFVPQVDFVHMTATFELVMGIYDFNFVMYLRMDASDPAISGFEGGIFASNLGLAPIGGDRFFAHHSSRQTIIPVLNGIRGVDQIYNRQGVQSSALGEGDPLNITGAKPGDDEYSPLWDLLPVVWTPAAISGGKRQRLHQDDEVKNFIQAGLLVALPGASGPPNPDFSNFPTLGVVSNCPIMLRVMSGLLPY